jgi:hypothetical protein
MPRNLAPHMYRVDARRKDQGRALLDGGSTPPPSNEDDPAASDASVHFQQDRTYQHKTELRRQAGNHVGIHPGAFCPVGTSGGPHLSTKKVTKRGEVFGEWRTREDYLPLPLVLILFVVS